MKLNNTQFRLKKHRRVFSLPCILLSLNFIGTSFSATVFAKGVEAGIEISNIATVNYFIENIPQSPINSSPNGNSVSGSDYGQATTFVVDRKVDLLVTGNSNTSVSPGDSQVELNFSLLNEGNDSQEFGLQIDRLLTSDDFDPNNCNLLVTGVTGTPLGGVTLPTAGNIKLKADQQASITVTCDIPPNNSGSAILVGQSAQVSLIATAEKNKDSSDINESTTSNTPDTVDTIFADGSGSDDAVSDAMHSARGSYVAAEGNILPNLTMDKTIVSVIDPNGSNSAITGSEVTYKILVNSSGVGNIDNLVITDPTPTDMTYKSNSIIVNNTNHSDANDGVDNTDFGFTNSNTATINLGSFAAGSQFEIQLTYIIN